MQFERDVSLEGLNTLGVTSRAENFCRVESDADWLAAIDYASSRGLGITLLGGGSNVVLGEQLRGLVVHPVGDDIDLFGQRGDDVLVDVLAGTEWDTLVRICNQRGWFGLENLVSIPGSCGAAPVQNIGAYGVEIAEFIESVRVLDLNTREFSVVKSQDCGFAYRYSYFKGPWRTRYAIVGIRLRLSKTPTVNTRYAALAQTLENAELHAPTPVDVLNTVAAIRAAKLPDVRRVPNSGSFFKNPIVSGEFAQHLQALHPDLPVYAVDDGSAKLAAAYLIEAAGLKGYLDAGCGISEDHALVLVNPGRATGAECLALAEHVISTVQSAFGVTLDIEPVVMGA